MRMTLDLLHEFANTEVFCLFHNRMWQSWYSEVNIYVLALCEQIDGLFTSNGPKRSANTGTQLIVNKSRSFIGSSAAKRDTFVDFLSNRTEWLLTLYRSSRPYKWIFGSCLGFLGAFTTSSNFSTQLLRPIVFKGNLWRRSR